MSINFLSIPPKKLSQSITSASSSFKLNNIKSWKKNSLGVNINLVAGDFGTTAYGCFRNDTGTKIEIFEFDPATIASASITITRRGLDFNGDLTTETTAYKLDWSANETTVQLGTDVPQLFQYLKEYIDGISISGVSDASATAAGKVELATQAQYSAQTALGETGSALVAPNTIGPVIETTAGVTHSLTTIAGQRVIVWAKGYVDYGSTGPMTMTLAYNGVAKDTVLARDTNGTGTAHWPFALMYTETPGAATQNITVTVTAGGTLATVIIIVLKF